MLKLFPAVLAVLGTVFLAGCGDSEDAQVESEMPVRGLKTVEVKAKEATTSRSYPSVLQPGEVVSLSFEVSGKLKSVDLKVGATVNAGDVLAEIETESLSIQAQSAQAALEQSQATAENARGDFQRKAQLYKEGIVTKAEYEAANASTKSADAAVEQARQQLAAAEDNLSKAVLVSPFDGIISSTEVESFTTVNAGSPVVSLYSDQRLEASFSVGYEILTLLAVGKEATVVLSDNPSIRLKAAVSEVASRADTASSFPVVVTLRESNPALKAGMAVAAELEFEVPSGIGFSLPLSVMALQGQVSRSQADNNIATGIVYVFDPTTSTVKKREVQIGGVSENNLIVISGLSEGEHVASAGVSFLRDGQEVKLLSTESRAN